MKKEQTSVKWCLLFWIVTRIKKNLLNPRSSNVTIKVGSLLIAIQNQPRKKMIG